MKYLSLCLPTNGIIEWVFPVLDNIYKQGVDPSEWEIIVTDNGDNVEFCEKMEAYAAKHENLIYKKTKAFLFENQIEALRLASGEYLKFMNHRSILEPGAIQWMINLVKETMDEKPVMYLSDGALHLKERQIYKNFDGFVRGLRQFASWTTGVGVWKSDFEKIPKDWKYNKISPHSDVLFGERNRDKYLIDDRIWCHDIDIVIGAVENIFIDGLCCQVLIQWCISIWCDITLLNREVHTNRTEYIIVCIFMT